MEALLAAELPEGEGWQFEPKWDGFRCLARRDGDEVTLTTLPRRSATPTGRKFGLMKVDTLHVSITENTPEARPTAANELTSVQMGCMLITRRNSDASSRGSD